MGVSENRGPEYSTPNSRILITRTPKKVTLVFGNFQILETLNPKTLKLGGRPGAKALVLKPYKP